MRARGGPGLESASLGMTPWTHSEGVSQEGAGKGRSDGLLSPRRTPLGKGDANKVNAVLFLFVIFAKWQMGRMNNSKTVTYLDQH